MRGLAPHRRARVDLQLDEHALHVRLDGPVERRVEQAIRIEGVDRRTAERHQAETDRARDAYVRQFYRRDARDLDLYHLVIDSTVIPLDTVTELIVTAVVAPTDLLK